MRSWRGKEEVMKVFKVLSAVLAVLVGLSGPVTVSAQSKEAGAPSMTAAETAKTPETGTGEVRETAYKVGAGVATALNIPMRGALCVLGGVAGFLVLVVTFGSGYRFAARATEEGCDGPWIITPAELRGEPAKDGGYN
jgi:hypothetical protein